MKKMKKRVLFILPIFLAICIFGMVYVVNAYQRNLSTNVNYPDIIAKVADEVISGKDLAIQIELEKNKSEKIKQPKDYSFYEKVALKHLITNILLDKDAEKRGLSVNKEEVLKYSNDTIKMIDAVDNNDPNKKELMNEIKSKGFSNIKDYMNDSTYIEVAKKVLAIAKLRNLIYSTTPRPTEEDIDNYIAKNHLEDAKHDLKIRESIRNLLFQQNKVNTWEKYLEELIQKSEFEVLVPINVK